MDEPQNELMRQAAQDSSVIDHLVKTFPLDEAERCSRTHVHEQSAALYHQIRKSWIRAR